MAGPRGPPMGPLHCILFLVPLLLSWVPGTDPATTHGPSSEGTSPFSQGITRPIASTSPESRLTEPTATPGLSSSLIPSTKHSSPVDHVASSSEVPPISTTAVGITAIGTTATSKYSSTSSAATEASIGVSPAAPEDLMTGNDKANGFSMEGLVPSSSTVVSTDARLEVPPVTEEVDYPNASVDSILELHNRSEAGSIGTSFENNVTSHRTSTSASPVDGIWNGTTLTDLSSPQFGLGLGSTSVSPSVETTTNATPSATKSPAPTSETPRGGSMALPPGEGNVAWPVKREAVVEGELVLGGLMMVHERGSGGKEGEKGWWCGPVMPQGGVQAVEAMLYTLDVLRGVPHPQQPGAGSLDVEGFLPGVSLGAHILDDCDSDTYGLEMAVDFIKGSISNIDGGAASDYSCSNRSSSVRKVISGVVGAASSVTSIQVANLLRLFKIPQVSFFSTSPELSNKQRFEYFSRTIPSDHYQVKAMVEIVRRMNWSYVSILYEESNYGIKAFEELEDLLTLHGICIAVKEKLVKDSGVAEEAAYDSIVLKLLTKPRAKGAIIFGSDQEVAGVMRAVRRCNATGSFWWIGSDGWSARTLVSDNNEPEVEGTLSVQPRAHPVQGFEEYFLSLTVENNKRNPWFVEFWEDHFRCRYPGSPLTPFNRHYTKACSSRERLTRQNTAFEGQLQFVSDAVMAFAHAFRDMHRDLCHGLPGLCDAMNPVKGTELLKYLRKVEFFGLSGDKFRFDPQGDGPARYNIIHFKQLSPGRYKWVRVGEYTDGELKLNMSEVQFRLNRPQPPESVCSFPCELGQAKKYVEGEICCWHCFNCTQYQVRHPTDETRCVPCPLGTVPDAAHVSCLPIPEVYLRPDSGWAIGAMALASSGILITLFVTTVFIKNQSTPVVRATGRELTSVLLVGLLMCYGMTFALALKPTDAVCGLQRFGAGFSFTLVYAALLTKTNRIARIFAAGRRTARRPACISPRSQLLICAALTSVQLLVSGVWFIVSPPRAIHHHPTRESNLLVCASHTDASFALAFGYPILLLIVTTVYAFLTRRIPEAFNESRQLGATMYATCVVWLAFVPTYFGTAAHVPLRVASVAVAFSLSASVAVACLFAPKLYIVLIRPELNVRQSRIGAMSSSSAAAAAAATAAAAAAAAAGSGTTTAAAVAVAGTRGTGGRPADAVRSGSNAHHGPSSQAVDSGTQSDGIDLRELREKVPCAAGGTKGKVVDFDDGTVVSRGTQTAISGCVVAVAINNNNSNSVGNGPMVTGDVPL